MGVQSQTKACGHLSDQRLPSVPFRSKCQAGGKLRAMCELLSEGSAWGGGLGGIIPVLFIELRFPFCGRGGNTGQSWIHWSSASQVLCKDRWRLLLWKWEETTGTKKLVAFSAILAADEGEVGKEGWAELRTALPLRWLVLRRKGGKKGGQKAGNWEGGRRMGWVRRG